jgi:hypothetical protein
VKNFWEFVEEREAIRIKKEAGESLPYTTDKIMQVNHFTNVDRINDKGTKFIINKINNIQDEKLKMLWVFIYRFSGSNQVLFNTLDLTSPNSLKEIPENVPKFYSGAYSRPCFPKGKGIGIRFLTKDLPFEIFDELYDLVSSLEKESIVKTAELITNQISDSRIWKKMRFHCSEIAKDLSIFFPEYVNPDSETALGKGALLGLRCLKLKSNPPSVWGLVNSESNKLNLTYNAMEHNVWKIITY